MAVRTILSADGKRRVLIIAKDAGHFDYFQEKLYEDGLQPFWAWIGEQPEHRFSSVNEADQDARRTIDWLKLEKPGGA